jgi:hypothetical protein
MQLPDNSLTFIALAGGGQSHSIVGSVSNIREALGQGNLNEQRLEVAIAQVEGLIMPVLRSFPAMTKLEIDGAELSAVFRLLSVNVGEAIPVESVERLFNQLADHVTGSPVAWRQSLSPEQVAVALVVLREVMHHGGYSSVSLFPRAE